MVLYDDGITNKTCRQVDSFMYACDGHFIPGT